MLRKTPLLKRQPFFKVLPGASSPGVARCLINSSFAVTVALFHCGSAVAQAGSSNANDVSTVNDGSNTSPSSYQQGQTLKGSVEQQSLDSGAMQDALQRPPGSFLEQRPQLKRPPELDGHADAGRPFSLRAEQDPDANDKDLMIAWDKWRNKFAHSVWEHFSERLAGNDAVFVAGVQVKLGSNPGYHFPDGLFATYTCVITDDRHIGNLRISSSSGNPTLDGLIMASVRDVDGKHMLTFPKGSKRQSVTETEALGIGKGGFRGKTYNDVEHQTVPGH
jgi:hypothetical protein